jgi:hypothetical protein
MKSLKRLGVSVTLLCVLTMAVFAGEVSSPPCAPPDPGEVSSPPCAAAQMTPDDSATPDQMSTAPASNVGADYSASDVALELLQSVLSIF